MFLLISNNPECDFWGVHYRLSGFELTSFSSSPSLHGFLTYSELIRGFDFTSYR